MVKLVITVPWGVRHGGAENMLWTFLRHVDRNAVEPLVVFFESGPFEREVSALGMATAVLPAGRLRHPGAVARTIGSLSRVLRAEKPQLLLNWMTKTHLYGSAAAALAGMTDRVVWWQHIVPDGDWLDRAATLLPARAIGCSSHESARAQRRAWPRRPAFVVHPGIEAPRESTDGERRAMRAKLGIPAGATVVGTVGRLQPWKGQDRIIRAIDRLRHGGHAVHGLIVGGTAYGLSPDYEPYLHQLVADLDLAPCLSLTGQVADATPYIGVMDVFVNASQPEPFGIVLLEAMAQRVPVVAVNAGGPAEMIESERSGLLVARADERLLAHEIERLVADESLRRRLAAEGHRRFLERFTAQRMTSEIERRLLDLASEAA